MTEAMHERRATRGQPHTTKTLSDDAVATIRNVWVGRSQRDPTATITMRTKAKSVSGES